MTDMIKLDRLSEHTFLVSTSMSWGISEVHGELLLRGLHRVHLDQSGVHEKHLDHFELSTGVGSKMAVNGSPFFHL
jgi:hypothetical protein